MIMEILSQDHHVKVDFLEFWIMRPGYYACIFLESTGFAIVTNHHDQCDDTSGITHITWVISYCLARISGMHEDPEERNDYSRFSSSSSLTSSCKKIQRKAYSSFQMPQYFVFVQVNFYLRVLCPKCPHSPPPMVTAIWP